MKKIFFRGNKMLSIWQILIFICLVLIAFFSLMSKKAEKKESQEDYASIRSDLKGLKGLIGSTDRKPSEEWIKLDFLNATEARVDCRFSDYIFLLFQASSGFIIGEIKIEGSDETYPFSTRANANLPIAIKNKKIPEEGRYKSYPNFKYRIKEKEVSESRLSIILYAVTEAGKDIPIILEKPIDIRK